MSKYPLIIEKSTNYALVINESKNLTFDSIRKYSTEFYRIMLTNDIQDRLYYEILHGACELDSESKLNAYMYALGKMHNAKLYKAFSNLSNEFKNEKTIDIIDYGCGQGLGCISYSDFLRENKLQQKVRKIVLIEPSEIALARAALNISAMYPETELITINKGFDDLTSEDLYQDKEIATLHILSNVLDLASTANHEGFYDLDKFAEFIRNTIDGKNEFVCIEPLFGYVPKDEKIDAFINKVGINIYYTLTKGKGEFVKSKDWTCVIRVGKVYKIENNLEKRNTMSLHALKQKQNSTIDIVKGNGKLANKLFFVCGSIKGYVSDKAKEIFCSDMSQEEKYESLEYMEIKYIDENSGKIEWLSVIYPKSKTIFKSFFEQAEHGDAEAQLRLGYCYEKGNGVEQNYEKAIECYTKSVEQGNAVAQLRLGYCYEKGYGVEQNYEKAIEWYTKSAKQGNASAMYNLALCYQEGNGVEQNYEKAVEWYSKSAEQGNVIAQNNLGWCYEKGYGVVKDYRKAVELFRKSIEQGASASQYNLGYCYENGYGVEINYEEAINCYQKAANEGIEIALEAIDKLKRKILEESNCKINGHEYVDLGLPSGLKWATCNVGANSPEEYGDYYAWGETETKDEYTEENSYTYGVKMNDISGDPKYDVARKKWGDNWRMPTYYEMEELIDLCFWEWKTKNGINGYKVTGWNHNSIFLPAEGVRCESSLDGDGNTGFYWSAKPFENNNRGAYYLLFCSGIKDMLPTDRIKGLSVRPVSE